MLEISNVTYGWNDKKLTYNYKIPQGKFVGLMGSSGAGKSTLLHLIAGILTPQSGSISWQGKTIHNLPPYKRPISLLFQQNNLFEHLNVWKNIAIGISPSLKLSREQQNQCQHIMAQLDIEEYQNRLPHQLSGGQQQRVALGRILLRQRPILLLDEPFSALDPNLRQRLLGLVLDLHQQNNLTTIFVSHHPSEIESIAEDMITI